MASILYKWLIAFFLSNFGVNYHPIFVSVTEIEHNAAEKTVEISCKIFVDDFEKTLRKKYNTKVDLLDAKLKSEMNRIVNDYIQKHFSVTIGGKKVNLQFLGFEIQEEGVISFFEVKNIAKVENIELVNNLLYEFNAQQMGIIHIMVNGIRKSSRLDNPNEKVSFSF
jgi:hypothetical protein